MKSKKKKIIVIALIVIILFSLNRVYAGIGTIADGLAGVLLFPVKGIPLLFGELVNILLGLFSGSGASLNLEDIFFNQVNNRLPLVNVNFFQSTDSMSEPMKSIATNVSLWYVGIRNLAIVLLVIIAIYVGIRMAMSTVAEEQAKYKNMLKDWLTSLALLFILHYIMILIIGLNDAIVNVLYTALATDGSGNVTDIANTLGTQAITDGFIMGMGEAIAFVILEGMTFIFLITYIRRMITVAFLIIIAPLVTVTYSIDKMKDGKSQALDTWLKEFSYNILIQPFHCVAYLALVSTSFTLLTGDLNLRNAIIAILMIGFLFKAEDIVKAIFGFKAQSLGKAITDAAFATAMYKNMTKVGKNANAGLNKYKEAKPKNGNKSNKNIQTKDSKDNDNLEDEYDLTQEQKDDLAAEGLTPKDQEYQQYIQQHGVNKKKKQPNDSQSQNNNTTNNQNDNKNPSNQKVNAKQDPNDIQDAANNNPSRKSQAGKKILGFAKTAVAKEVKWGTAIGLGALGYSADEDIFKGAMVMGEQGYELGKNFGNTMLRKGQERKMVKAFRNYQDEHPELSQKQIVKNSIDLLNGDRNANTDAEVELREELKRLKGIHASADAKDPDKLIKKELNDAYEGRISERQQQFRFTGPKFSKKRNSNTTNSNGSTTNSGSQQS